MLAFTGWRYYARWQRKKNTLFYHFLRIRPSSIRLKRCGRILSGRYGKLRRDTLACWKCYWVFLILFNYTARLVYQNRCAPTHFTGFSFATPLRNAGGLLFARALRQPENSERNSNRWSIGGSPTSWQARAAAILPFRLPFATLGINRKNAATIVPPSPTAA